MAAVASHAPTKTWGLFEEGCPSVSVRFPGVDGKVLFFTKVLQAYKLKENVTLHFFADSELSELCLHRHKLKQRRHATVLENMSRKY